MSATFTDGTLFGIYLTTAAFANRWLIFKDEGWNLKKNIHWFMVAVTNLILAMLIANMGVVVTSETAQTHYLQEGHGLSGYNKPPWIAIVACMLANSIALLADIVLMYRLWVVYAKQMWVVWFPIFLWLGGIVCTILQLFLQVKHVHNPNFGPYHWATVDMTVGPGIVLIPFWISTIMLNAYCTGILIWKIWSASKKGENNTASKQLQFLVRILMESGILYLSISLAHFFVWFGHDDDAIHMLGAVNVIVIGIAFNLVIIRTAKKRVESSKVYHDSGKSTKTSSLEPVIRVNYTTSVETDSSTVRQSHGLCSKETVDFEPQ